MHITTRSESRPRYRERLSPSLWLIVSAAVIAPMITLVLTPVNATVAGLVGVAAAAIIIGGIFWLSPVVEVGDGWLRVGHARIETRYLADAVALTGEDARLARGPRLARTSWHFLRGGIAPVVQVAVVDPDDPVKAWVFSSRTPERIVDAIDRENTSLTRS